MLWDDLQQACAPVGLKPLAAADLAPSDGFGTGQAVLLAPDGSGFWAKFAASADYSDGAADPLDRYSKRIVAPLAKQLGAQAVFPSDGPPYPPFIAWALRSGAVHQSPVGLLVHHDMGLFTSFRAAILLQSPVKNIPTQSSPCDSCETRPCTTACPVQALAAAQPYDVARCKSYAGSAKGADCLQGCLARRACPASAGADRLPAQSAFHMKAFLCPD